MDRDAFSPAAMAGNVARLYEETARAHPDRTALVMDDRRLTHGQLLDRGTAIAGGLGDRGLEPGDRLAIYLPNSPTVVEALLGGFAAGTPPVPLNPQFRPREVAAHLADCDAAAIVTEPSLLETVTAAIDRLADPPRVILAADGSDAAPIDTPPDLSVAVEPFDELRGDPVVAERADDDVALHPYTSGTTGEPKGVLLTTHNIRTQSLLGFDRTLLPADRERYLSPLPLAHIAGLVNRTWQPLVRGGTVYLMDPAVWDPESLMATIEAEGITKLGAVATMYVDIVNHDAFDAYDLSSLEEAMQGGTKLPTPVARAFEAATGVRPFEAYGMTETGGGTHVGLGSTFGHRVGTIGQPLRATDCKVVDDEGREVPTGEPGELLLRGPHVMAGYHERPEATAAAFTDDGYFRTGDVVVRDGDNYYEVLDRKADVIDTGGYNVYPAEIEDVLYQHPDVDEVAVVGEPDDRRGERVVAYVVPAGQQPPSESDLRTYLADRLAAYKRPRELRFVAALPRTASGKIRRIDLGEDD